MSNGSPLRGPDAHPRPHDPPHGLSVVGSVGLSVGAPSRSDQERGWSSDQIWLTAGEAANAADVTHRQIAAWIASEDLSARTGWRGGTEIRLVLLEDLERLAERVDLDEIRGSLAARGVFTGPRHSLPGADSEAGQAGSDDFESAVGAAGLERSRAADVQPADREWAIELEQEIQRLRGVITTLREDHESLERHLESRGAVVNTRRLGTGVGASMAARATASAAPSLAAPVATAPLPAATGGSARGSTGGALAALVGGLILGLASAALASSWLREGGSVATKASTVLAADRSSLSLGGPAGTEAVMGTLMKATEASPAPLASSGEAANDDASGPVVTEPEAAGRDARTPVRPRRAGLAAHGSRATSNVSAGALAAPKHLHPPVALADIEPGIFSRNSSVLADCAYTRFLSAASAAGEPSGDLVLGPCFGPARDGDGDQLAVPGTHRVGNVSCCRHHAFVERMTSASVDDAARAGLRTEAIASLAEGLLPPLFRLRADRSASRFLREETRGWESAGLDGSAGLLQSTEAVHEWKLLERQPKGQGIRVSLVSWLQPIPNFDPDRPAGNRAAAARETAKLQRFRMTLLIQAAPRGDVLESFEWLKE